MSALLVLLRQLRRQLGLSLLRRSPLRVLHLLLLQVWRQRGPLWPKKLLNPQRLLKLLLPRCQRRPRPGLWYNR